jgi:hypothetical protein
MFLLMIDNTPMRLALKLFILSVVSYELGYIMKIEGGCPLATLIGLPILSHVSLIFIILRLRLLQEVNLHTFNMDLV